MTGSETLSAMAVKWQHQPCLRGLIIIRCHKQQRVRAKGLRLARLGDGVPGIVGAGARDQRHPAAHRLYGTADDGHVLLLVEGRGLAAGAAHQDRVGTVFDLEFDELL